MENDRQRQHVQHALAHLARKRPLAAVVAAVVLVVVVVAGGIGFSSADKAGSSSTGEDVSSDAAAPDAIQAAEVIRVVDGDTLKVRLADGEENYVRLIGIDTPESVASDKSRNCEEGTIAADFTKSLVSPGQTVWLSRDVSDTDTYGRWLRYVWLELPDDSSNEGEIASKMLNAILVQEGYAQVKRYKPDTTLHDMFEQWGDKAAADGKGVTHVWA